MIKKYLRFIREIFFALKFFKNPRPYFLERVGFSSSKTILLRLRNGISYFIPTNKNEIYIINEIWNIGTYNYLSRFITDNSIVIDIGANIGIFSIKAAKSAKNVKVFSFEPFEENFEMLKKNVHLNSLQDNIRIVRKAVAGKPGELELFYQSQNSGIVSMHQNKDNKSLKSFKVPAITLENIFKEYDIEECQFLKIDCEGAEEVILLNTPKDLFKRIKSITIEWHHTLNSISVEEFKNFLEERGYKTLYHSPTLILYAWH